MARTIRNVLLGVLSCGLLCGCWQTAKRASRDTDAIWEVRKHIEDAINNGDANALRDLFTEDAVFVICNGPVVEGFDAIQKMHIDFFRENPGFKTEFIRQHISFPTKDAAIETVSFTDRFPGQAPRYGGDTTVYVKNGGRWMIKCIRMHPSEANAKPIRSQSIAPPHQFELAATDHPELASEGVYIVGWIRVLRPENGFPIQTITVQMDEPDVSWAQRQLEKQDINFDGYADIAVIQHGGAKWGRFHWWLYDPKRDRYYSNSLTRELSELTCADLKADPKSKRITRTQFIGAELKECVYEVVGERLHLCESSKPD